MLQNQTSIWNAKYDNLATVTIDSTIYDSHLDFVTKTLAPASVRALPIISNFPFIYTRSLPGFCEGCPGTESTWLAKHYPRSWDVIGVSKVLSY